jgi:FMN phosphatase YigB (HAD superfamily)
MKRTIKKRGDARSNLRRLAADLDRTRPRLVLVDCFGTLLHRSVPRGRVRVLATQELAKALGRPEKAEDILDLRQRLERELRQERSSPRHLRDYRLPALALALHQRLDPTALPNANEFCRLFCTIELAIERAITQPNRELVEILSTLDDSVQIAVASDTHLTEPMLRELLQAHRIESVADRIIVSSDAGDTKRSGLLYEQILRSCQLSPSEVFMVGDNPVADRQMATTVGIPSFILTPGRWDQVKDAPSMNLRRDAELRLKEALEPADDRDVFPEFALSLWLFTARLDSGLRRAGADKALFLAREGLLLKDLFDRFQASHDHLARPALASAYLLTSRKSTFLPALSDPESQLRRLLESRPETTCTALSALLGVPVPPRPAAGHVDAPVNESDLAALLGTREALAVLERERVEQSDLLRELVAELASDSGALHLVDVGWNGTVRDQLAEVLPDRPVHAHLLGMTQRAPLPGPSLKTAYLFTNQPRRSAFFQVFSQFKQIYELLLAADHGSAARYSRGDDGRVEVVLDDNETERKTHAEHIGPFQTTCRARFDAVSRVLGGYWEEPPWLEALVARHHARMIYRPRTTELDFADALAQFDNFGGRPVDEVGEGPPDARRLPYLRRHVAQGGWPPLRMRRSGADWQRYPYAALKLFQLRRGRLR